MSAVAHTSGIFDVPLLGDPGGGDEFLYTHRNILDAPGNRRPGPALRRGTDGVDPAARRRRGLTVEALRELCAGKLTHYKTPRYVHVVDESPMTWPQRRSQQLRATFDAAQPEESPSRRRISASISPCWLSISPCWPSISPCWACVAWIATSISVCWSTVSLMSSTVSPSARTVSSCSSRRRVSRATSGLATHGTVSPTAQLAPSSARPC